jgi:hypothetical protein
LFDARSLWRRNVPSLKTYNIFVIHSHGRDGGTYADLLRLLQDQPNFKFKDGSVPKIRLLDGPDEKVGRDIAKLIRQADVVLALTNVATSKSGWISLELETAKKYGKRIIAVVPAGGRKGSRLVQQHATQIVPWDGAAIVKCIRNPNFRPRPVGVATGIDDAKPVAAVPVGQIVRPAVSPTEPPRPTMAFAAESVARPSFWRRLYPFGRRASPEAAKGSP